MSYPTVVDPLQTVGLGDPIYDGAVDIISRYDKAITTSLDVRLSVPYRYTEAELERMPLDKLRELSKSRGKVFETDQRSHLIRAVLNSQRVPVVFAPGIPEYSALEDTSGIPNQSIFESVFYPIIAVQRLAIKSDWTRFSRPIRRKLSWSHDGNLVAQSPQPIPKRFMYQIDVASLRESEMNQIVVSLERVFGTRTLTTFNIDHGSPWGVLPIYGSFEDSYRETSVIEGSPDRAEKLIRRVWTLYMDGWFPQAVKMQRTVRKVGWTLVDNIIEARPVELEELPFTDLQDTYEDRPLT